MLKQVQNTPSNGFIHTGVGNYFTANNLNYFLSRYSTKKTDVSVGADKKQLLVDSIIPSDTLAISGIGAGPTLDQLWPLMPLWIGFLV